MVAEIQERNQNVEADEALPGDVSKPIIVISDNDNEDNGGDVMSSKNVEEIAIQYKQKGNAFYSKKEFDQALDAYQLGIQILLDESSSSSSPLSFPPSSKTIATHNGTFQADEVALPQLVCRSQDALIIDFPSARFMSSGMVG